jgi:hypothetical protein
VQLFHWHWKLSSEGDAVAAALAGAGVVPLDGELLEPDDVAGTALSWLDAMLMLGLRYNRWQMAGLDLIRRQSLPHPCYLAGGIRGRWLWALGSRLSQQMINSSKPSCGGKTTRVDSKLSFESYI